MATVKAVKRKHEGRLMSLPGVVGVGIGRKEGRDCICVYVTDDSPGQPAKGLMQPDPHRKPIADEVFDRDVAALRVALSGMSERRA